MIDSLLQDCARKMSTWGCWRATHVLGILLLAGWNEACKSKQSIPCGNLRALRMNSTASLPLPLGRDGDLEKTLRIHGKRTLGQMATMIYLDIRSIQRSLLVMLRVWIIENCALRTQNMRTSERRNAGVNSAGVGYLQFEWSFGWVLDRGQESRGKGLNAKWSAKGDE